MKITEVRVTLMSNKGTRLKAFCSVTMDNEFVVRDIKVIEGAGGHFVAMPSRKMTDHCEKCGGKNHLRAKFCNNCGAALRGNRARKDVKGRIKMHIDIAHPVNLECRKRIQAKVISAFKEEMEKSRQPGYKSVEMEEPAEMDKPAEMDEPDEMDKPAEMDESVEMDKPAEMDESVEMDEPDEMDKPAEMDDSVEMDESDEMDKPAEMDDSVEMDESVGMDKPDEEDESVEMDKPDEEDEPDDEVPEIIS